MTVVIDLELMVVHTTVQSKAIAHPTDPRRYTAPLLTLVERMILQREDRGVPDRILRAAVQPMALTTPAYAPPAVIQLVDPAGDLAAKAADAVASRKTTRAAMLMALAGATTERQMILEPHHEFVQVTLVS